MRIHLVHGIHNQGESAATEALIPYLQGMVLVPDYGWIAAVETRRLNPVIAGSLAPYIWPEDVMIGHSNGCAIIYRLLMMGVKMRGVVLINGALKQDVSFPAWLKFIHIYSNSGDDITEVAEVGEEIGLYDEYWGAMGHFNYTGTDPRPLKVFCDQLAPTMPVCSGHGDLFTPQHVSAWGPFIMERAAAAF